MLGVDAERGHPMRGGWAVGGRPVGAKWAPLPSTSAFQLLPVTPSLVCTNPRPLQPKLEDQEFQEQLRVG